MTSLSESLAELSSSLTWEQLPEPVVATTKRHLADTIGVALAAARMDFATRAIDAAKRLSGPGDTLVLGHRDRLRRPWAAFANGTLAHGLDFDDTHTESVVHVSASVVPAALAALDSTHHHGRDLIAALAIGMESNVRIGLAAPGSFHDRGFHPTGICGTFASALVAAALGGHDTTVRINALGLCASTAAGSLEFLTDGTWAKRIHGGWAAHAGLAATELAAAGFSGPRGALDGRFGLYRSHLGKDDDWSAVTRDLGKRWHLLDTALKPYPCCHFNHAFIDAALALRRTHHLAASDVSGVTCWVAEREMPVVCDPRPSKVRPQSDYDAKFSLPYAVACALVRGEVGIDDFEGDAIDDPAVLDLARRVECVADPHTDYPRRFPGRLRVDCKDGRQLQHDEPINRGSAERPLSDQEVEAKFLANAERVLSPAAARSLADSIEALTDDGGLVAFVAALDATAQAGAEPQ